MPRSWCKTLPPPAIPGTFISDPKTGETNELIILLNYDSYDRLSTLIPGLARASAAPIVERGFLEVVNSAQSNAAIAFGHPTNTRQLMATGRMNDAERAKQVKLLLADGKGGVGPNPREQLERYLILRYESIALAKAQMARLNVDAAVSYSVNNGTVTVSSTPSDPYFSNNGVPAQYQWGMHAMNFPTAWDSTRGQAYVGVLDLAWPGTVVGSVFTAHSDLQASFRPQMMNVGVAQVQGGATPFDRASHTVHVVGIIGAAHNNGAVAGGCPECNIVVYPFYLDTQPTGAATKATLVSQLVAAVDSGMQVINWSGGIRDQSSCQNSYWSNDITCAALSFATTRSVLVVISSGNENNVALPNAAPLSNGPQFPGNMHDGSAQAFSVLPVGGVSWTGARWTAPLSTAVDYPGEAGANFASSFGVSAPAEKVVSTFNAGSDYNSPVNCTDKTSYDLSAPRFSNGVGDGVGTCTGTSMAAPHISGLAGLLRSVNPRATASAVRTMIRESGNLYPNPTVELGFGVPNAATAVGKAVVSNPNRLTPLFSYYSQGRSDSMYTTVPQMARAAAEDKLLPRNPSAYSQNYAAAYGTQVTGYFLPPESPVSVGPDPSRNVKAEVWVFTTDLNPKSATVRLSPIVRMSWKCGDPTPYPPALCSSNSGHSDTVLVLSDKATNQDEVPYFKYLGYQVDGIEGFVYPKSLPRPLGAVKLMRKYHAGLDDHANFPESAAASMGSNGWTYDTNGTDWLGYVYPNTGSMPTIQ